MMTPALLALAILAQPETSRAVGPRTARQLARACIRAERRHGLPPGLLCAVALAETGGRSRIRRYGRDCDVGPWQLRVPGCPGAVVRIMTRAGIEAQAEAAAWLLRIRRDPAGPCPWWRYNPGSRRWCKKVMDIQRRLTRVRPDA